MKLFPSNDLDLIDRRFPEILTALGWTPTHTTTKRITGACPIHNGTDPNFQLYLAPDGKWFAICRSQCGGTVWTSTRFVAEYLAIPHAEAIPKAAKLLGITPTEAALPHPPRRKLIEHAAIRCEKAAEAARLTAAITSARPSLLAPYLTDDWGYDFWDSSEIRIPPAHAEQAHLFARHLFHPEETLWMGGEKDSGQPRHAAHFRTREEWERESTLPPRIAPGVFRPGSYSRSGENITAAPFIIIESDELIGRKPETQEERDENRKQCAALIAFMRDRFSLTLRAVIDTGGKSLHGWFDRPSQATLDALDAIAGGLAIDPPVVTRAHGPLRLPGCVHATTGQPAQLLYLNPRTF